MDITNPNQQNEPEESLRKASVLINGYLVKLQLSLDQTMLPERVGLYLQALCRLSERQIHYAFAKAITSSAFIPKITELLAWAEEGAIQFQRSDTSAATAKLLDRGDKPPDWGRMDSVWAEIDRREAEQEARDLAYVEPYTDAEIDLCSKLGKPYPGKDRYVDYARRKEARERQARGEARPVARGKHMHLFETIQATQTEKAV